jgi:lipopolysaccharide transport system permease protein
MLVPLSTLLSVLLDLLVGLALFAVLAAIFQVAPGWAVLLAPVWLLAIMFLALGVGLMASALMVPYRDMQYIVPYGLQILLYASPVAYSLSSVPDSLRWLYDFNPLTWLLEGFRWSLLGLAPPPFWASVICILASVLVFLIGTVVFEKFERGFADVI